MGEIDEHFRNLKDTVERIRNLDAEKVKEPSESSRNMQPETFREIVQRLRNLQAERKGLLVEIEELRKMANTKATALEREIAELRIELKSLKNLMEMPETNEDKTQSEEYNRKFK